MKKIVFLTFFSVFLFTFLLGFAAQSSDRAGNDKSEGDGSADAGNKPVPVKKKSSSDVTYSRDMIYKNLMAFSHVVKKGNTDGTPVLAVQFKGFAGAVDAWLKYPDLEYDTRITARWYKKVAYAFNKLYEPRRAMELAKLDKNKAKYKAAEEVYDKYLKILDKILKKPESVPADEMKKLRDDRRKRLERERELRMRRRSR